VPAPVVVQQEALRRNAVAPRFDSTADEQVDRTVAVVIGGDDP
jgi:hypothetical protein